MKKKLPQYTWIALFFAFLLKQITYSIGNFNFANASLFSLYSLCDFIILIIYAAIIQYIIIKIMAKRDQIKDEE
jgi:hypothetical protein